MADSADQGSGEDRLIARFFRPLVTESGALDLTDDAAFMQPPAGCDLVVTADAIVAGVHYLADDPAKSVARKALRVNLSDLAAKGARPLGFLLTLALPKGIADAWLEDFSAGLKADIAQYECPLYGGDCVSTPGPAMMSVAMVGSVPQGAMMRRAGAKPGDLVMVSGTIGDAALGLAVQTKKSTTALPLDDRAYLIARYRLPQPRMGLGDVLRANATAAMDVSDGLAGDLAKLCRASGVGARMDAADVPLSAAAISAIGLEPSLFETALSGGDDYEILCTVAPDKANMFQSDAADVGVKFTDIGEIVAGEGAPVIVGHDGKPLRLSQASFSHF